MNGFILCTSEKKQGKKFTKLVKKFAKNILDMRHVTNHKYLNHFEIEPCSILFLKQFKSYM